MRSIQKYLPSKMTIIQASVFMFICGGDFILPNILASFAAIRRGNDILKESNSLEHLLEMKSGRNSLDYLHGVAEGWIITLSIAFAAVSSVIAFSGIRGFHAIKKKWCPNIGNSYLETNTNKCIGFFKARFPRKEDLGYLGSLWLLINLVSFSTTAITSVILQDEICHATHDEYDGNPEKICLGFEGYPNITNSDLQPLKSLAKKVSDTQVGVGVTLGLIVSTAVSFAIIIGLTYWKHRKSSAESSRLLNTNTAEKDARGTYGIEL